MEQVLGARPELWYTAFVLFILAAFSDFLDGMLARRLKEVSVFGRIADPLVDKMLTIGTYFGRTDGPFWYSDRRLAPPEEHGIDGLFGSLPFDMYLNDLRDLPEEGRLAEWMSRRHKTRVGLRFHLMISPPAAFDAIVYIDRLTSAVRQPG